MNISTIEAAIKALYGGTSFNVTADGGSVTVPIYIDDPDKEVVYVRSVPSVYLMFSGMQEDAVVTAAYPWEIFQDYDIDQTHSRYKKRPVGYEFSFTFHTFAKTAESDRRIVEHMELVHEPRDGILLDAEYYRITRRRMAEQDNYDHDKKIYHKVWDLSVFGLLQSDTILTYPVIRQMTFNLSKISMIATEIDGISGNYPVDDNNVVVDTASQAGTQPLAEYTFDVTGEWITRDED